MSLLTFNFAQDVIDALAAEHRTGLIFVDEFGHRRDYSFAEISDHSKRYAAVLRAFGVARGDRVLLRTSNTAKCLFTILALQRLGATAVMCMEFWTDAQVLERVAATQPRVIVSNRRHRASVDALRDRLPADTTFVLVGEECEGWARLDALVSRAQPYAGIPTPSAETSLISNNSYSNLALFDVRGRALEQLGAGAGDVVWCTLPMGRARWLANAAIAPWSCGAATVVHEGPFEPRERLELVRDLDVTVLWQAPHEYAAELDLPNPGLRFPRLHRCIFAGIADAALSARWNEEYGMPIDDAIGAAPLLQKV